MGDTLIRVFEIVLWLGLAGGALVIAYFVGFLLGREVGHRDGWVECFQSVKRAKARDHLPRWVDRVDSMIAPEVRHG